MGTPINKATPVTPALTDQIAIWDQANSNTRKTSLNYLLELFEANMSNGKPDTQYEAPNATDFSVTVDSEDGTDIHLLLAPAAGYADGTIVLPSTGLEDKQTVLVTCTQAITTLVVSSTKTLYGEPSSMAADDFFTLKYDLTFDSWYRVG